ncbi:MAG: nucleoside triphosphate pyrophosphohydrolase [Bacteroidota bacterium]
MSRVYYNKLVRDQIAETIRSKGEVCEVRTLTDEQEFQQELLKKVIEEATALAQARTREEFLSEYADLMVVLDTLTQALELTPADVGVSLEENITKKGKYEQRHFLHWSEDSGYESNETPQGIR